MTEFHGEFASPLMPYPALLKVIMAIASVSYMHLPSNMLSVWRQKGLSVYLKQ